MLRRRFLLALLPLPLLFLGVGIYAVFLLSNLSRSIDQIVSPTFASITAADELQKAGLQFDYAASLALEVKDEKAVVAFQLGATNFQQNLSILSRSLSVPGDEGIERNLEAKFAEILFRLGVAHGRNASQPESSP